MEPPSRGLFFVMHMCSVIERGCRFPQTEFCGKVRGVYDRAVNVIGKGTDLLSIVIRSADMTVSSVLVDALPRCNVGDTVQIQDGVLTAGDLQWSLTTPCVFSGQIFAHPFPKSARITALMDVLNQSDIQEGLLGVLFKSHKRENVFCQHARPILGHIAIERVIDLSELIGLGQGLTPSGDDFATGVLAGSCALPGRRTIMYPSLKIAAEGTTAEGRNLLLSASDGHFPSYLCTFVECYVTYEAPVSLCISEALSHGATSGADSVAGFAWYLSLDC